MHGVTRIHLVGWPGAGKAELAAELAVFNLEVEVGHALAWWQTPQPVWALIDPRSRVEDSLALQKLLAAGDVLILMFWHQIGLDDQAWWLKQCRLFAPNKPYLLKTAQALTQSQLNELLAAPKTAIDPVWPTLKVLQIDAPYTVVLEHAMFVLDSARRLLNGKLWRVRWVCQTLEYVNPVVIDMIPTRFETLAALPHEKPGSVRVVGEGIDDLAIQNQLNEWLLACRAPGA